MSSIPLARPSIQPKHSATTTASAADTEGMPEDFLASFRWNPGSIVWFCSRKVSNSLAEGNEWIGKSFSGVLDVFVVVVFVFVGIVNDDTNKQKRL